MASLHVVFDTETTGLSPYKARVLSLAACAVLVTETCDTCRVVSSFYTFVNPGPGVIIPKVITKITGIDKSAIEHAPDFIGAWRLFETWIMQVARVYQTKNLAMTAHNAIAFDIPVIAWELASAGYARSPSRAWLRFVQRTGLQFVMDTLRYVKSLSHSSLYPARSRKLGDLYSAHVSGGKKLVNAHDALVDVDATVQVFYDRSSKLSSWLVPSLSAKASVVAGWSTPGAVRSFLVVAESRHAVRRPRMQNATIKVCPSQTVISTLTTRANVDEAARETLQVPAATGSSATCLSCGERWSTYFQHACQTSRPTKPTT